MKLAGAYARFYKSFNFDHARKLHPKAVQQPWELFRGRFYPYVTVEFDQRITTVVGANESGKSHLLSVIKKAIKGEGIEQRDLCRYSPFFGVAKGQTCWPHVGVGWNGVSEEESSAIAEVLGGSIEPFTRFLMFREQPDRLIVWTPKKSGDFTKHELTAETTAQLQELLPHPFEIDANVALPNSIPFSYLKHAGDAPAASLSRSKIERLLAALIGLRPVVDGGIASIQHNAQDVVSTLSEFTAPMEHQLDAHDLKSLKLGRDLLLTLGEIDPASLTELASAIDQQHDGYVGGLLEAVNQQLERRLNFRRYWVQDRDFSLRVATRDRELVFVISDRTGTVYTFNERSSGLRYFLSYLIQAQVHRPSPAQESILLMDEPDTFLSAEAQQDLMRVFRDLAEPEPGVEPIQVIYVTHSPFLLDKNHAERIRVLEKGTGFDGSRVVPSVSRNHYEPLRSAFGPFVGESAFVGSVNLLVEGGSDQIILAGAANLTRLRSPGILDDTLDLNRMVIVPSGSATEIAYAVFRIRGQGAEKPPVVVLLDGDKEGTDAKADFSNDDRLRRLVKPSSLLDLAQIGEGQEDWPSNPVIEDLVPAALAHKAMQLVINDIVKFRSTNAPSIGLTEIKAEIDKGLHVLEAINVVAKRYGGKIEKLPFAKAVIEACREETPTLRADIGIFLDRMKVIFRAVNEVVRSVTEDAANRRLETIVAERAELFKIDNPNSATREQALIALRQIESQLDESGEAEAIRNAIIPLRRDYQLAGDLAAPVPNYAEFLIQMAGLKHAYRSAQLPVDRNRKEPIAEAKPKDGKTARQATRNPGKTAAPVAAKAPAQTKPKAPLVEKP